MKKRRWKEHFLSILLCLTMVMGQVFPLAGLAYASEGPPSEGGYSDPKKHNGGM